MSCMAKHISSALSVSQRAALRHGISGALCNSGMKTVEQVRLERLRLLKEEFGSWAKLNELIELPARDSTLSQIANGSPNSKTKKPKTMGSDLARRLEASCKKEEGWMDTDPDLLRGRTVVLTPWAERVGASALRLNPTKRRELSRILDALLSDDPRPEDDGADEELPTSTTRALPAPSR